MIQTRPSRGTVGPKDASIRKPTSHVAAQGPAPQQSDFLGNQATLRRLRSGGDTISSGHLLPAQLLLGNQGILRRLQHTREAPESNSVAEPAKLNTESSSSGQPLDPATRAVMEPRFGHDFSAVRVHTGTAAAESARKLNANAYTKGRNIIFGAGQFLPATQAGRQLLSHELAHVVQQRRSPATDALSLSSPGDFHERQADAVADANRRGGDIAGILNSASGPACAAIQRSPQGPPSNSGPGVKASPSTHPLDYDNLTTYTIAPPKRGLTAAAARKAIADQGQITDPPIIKGASGNAEIFLLNIIWHIGTMARRGTEVGIITDIDWPAKVGDPTPQGRVVVSIDSQGKATAELIGAGPVPAVPQMSFVDGVTELTKLGLGAVTGWSGDPATNAAEISDVVAALGLLKRRAPSDLRALQGVNLIRVPSIPNADGEFSAADKTLKLADKAFSTNNALFYRGGKGEPSEPSSFQTILHEVGHAVEEGDYLLAKEGYDKAAEELDAAQKSIDDATKTYSTRLKEAKNKDSFYKKEGAAYEARSKAKEKIQQKVNAEDTKVRGTRVAAAAGQTAAPPTLRLQKFIDLVNTNGIRQFTDYSARNWKLKPQEFYAEAYSLWLLDPNFLQTNYKLVFEFFENGDYRK